MIGNYKPNSGNEGFNYSYISNKVPGNSINIRYANSDFKCCLNLVGTTTINFQSKWHMNLRLNQGVFVYFPKLHI
jgi:hypothetical protein